MTGKDKMSMMNKQAFRNFTLPPNNMANHFVFDIYSNGVDFGSYHP